MCPASPRVSPPCSNTMQAEDEEKGDLEHAPWHAERTRVTRPRVTLAHGSFSL